MDSYKPIPNFQTYGINESGEVMNYRSGKIVPAYPTEDGYYRLTLKNPDGISTQSVARLVGLTFIPNPDNLPTIDHIDRNRGNNNVNNLRWASLEEQAINKGCRKDQKFKRFVSMEFGISSKNPYRSYTIQMRNSKLTFKKRFRCDKYSIDEVYEYRNKLLTEHDIPITD